MQRSLPQRQGERLPSFWAAVGWLVAPGFFALSAFVGAGLMFAGVTGWCGMAHLLRVMPWNRRSGAVR